MGIVEECRAVWILLWSMGLYAARPAAGRCAVGICLHCCQTESADDRDFIFWGITDLVCDAASADCMERDGGRNVSVTDGMQAVASPDVGAAAVHIRKRFGIADGSGECGICGSFSVRDRCCVSYDWIIGFSIILLCIDAACAGMEVEESAVLCRGTGAVVRYQYSIAVIGRIRSENDGEDPDRFILCMRSAVCVAACADTAKILF